MADRHVTDEFTAGCRSLEEGREAIAMEYFVVAADTASSPEERLAALAHAAEISLSLGRPFEAIAWTERLRREAPRSDQADLLEAVAHVRIGAPEHALALLASVTEPGTAHHRYRPSSPQLVRAQALLGLARIDEATDALAAALAADPTDPDVWATLASLCDRLDVDPTPILDALPATGFAETFGHLVDAPAGGADRILEALWQRSPGDARVIALMAYIGHRLPLDRALEWSGRLRAAGHGTDCALLGVAASGERSASDRVRAAAVAWSTFADDRASALIELAGAATPDRDLASALQDVGTLAPELTGNFLVAVATTPSRALIAAQALHAGGAAGVAVTLLRHAVDLAEGRAGALEDAVAEALSTTAVSELTAAAEATGADDVAEALRAAA